MMETAASGLRVPRPRPIGEQESQAFVVGTQGARRPHIGDGQVEGLS
ncbi:hypothetical protein [Streptomyces sp. SID12488]|nr:hypothetical protein [Streptomyces sp. SID12488]NEA63957.1 hypothetical protein [Streptomyces sp. SID12488]